MKSIIKTFVLLSCVILLASCSGANDGDSMYKIVFLHHSTGGVIWEGDLSQVDPSIVSENPKIKAQIPLLFAHYNDNGQQNYSISELNFPKASPYGWNNYPYDYYNIWVKNAGNKAYLKEPTLEILTEDYNVIVFKHCYPVSNIVPDAIALDIDSDIKSLQNYKLQYQAIKEKMHEFTDTKFIVFTGAVQVKALLTEEEANRAREFYTWVTQEWDQPDDNIFIWDLYELQTEGGLYFKDEYAVSSDDSHPNKTFAGRAANLLFDRLIDVIENNGLTTSLTGEKL